MRIVKALILNHAVVTIIVCATCIGIGLTVCRKWTDAFWIGWASIIIFLIGWHLVAPINSSVSALLAVIGICSLVYYWKRLTSSVLLVVLLSGFTAQIAMNASPIYDDGLYHWQVVKWYYEYPVVPGLANLHGRFGFNSSFYLYGALFNNLDGGPLRYAIGPMLVMFLTASLMAAFRISRGDYRTSTVFEALLCIPALLWIPSVATLSNDVVALLLGLKAFQYLFHFSEQRYTLRQEWVSFVIILAVTVTIKLSIVVFAFGVFAVAWWLVRPPRQTILLVLLPASIVGLLWIIHGIILSGYPLYPATVAGIDVDWRTPEYLAVADAEAIYHWARTPGTVSGSMLNWGWVDDWWQRIVHDTNIWLPLLLTGISVVPAWLCWRKWWPFVPAIPAIVFWFLTAPDPRFGMFAFWSLALSNIALALPKKITRLTGRVLVVLVVVILGLNSLLIKKNEYREQTPTTTVIGIDGHIIHQPIQGDQCWDAPLPCTPSEAPVRRTIDSMRDGFRPPPLQ